MCRIIGEVVFDGALTDYAGFKKLTALSKAGGPDSTGFWDDGVCRLGFNRLAILDTSNNGNQPVLSPSGRFAMVFNGEIYNYLDLKRKYGIADHQLRSSSDTEIIAQLLDLLPVNEMVRQLDGMFGIAVWDRHEQTLYLMRDFAGIKPLHFGVNKKGIAFASQYNQVALHQWFAGEGIDDDVLAQYLKRHYIPSPKGLLTNTYQVAPGEIITFDLTGKMERERYWELPLWHDASLFSEAEALEYVAHELERSVKAQLMSDVPLGAFLSGGIDSPLICRYAQKNISGKLNTFTIGSDSTVHDESDMALQYAAMLGVNPTVGMTDSKTVASMLDEVMAVVTEPFADISVVPTYFVSKLARKNVTVALSGDGGDELFFGYDRFWSVGQNIRYQSWPYAAKYLLYGANKVVGRPLDVNSSVLFDSQGRAHQRLHSRTAEGHFSRFAPMLDFNSNHLSPEYQYELIKREPELLQRMRYSEYYDMMQKTLRKVDLASMGNSLEVRVPFLQKSFIEASLNVSYKLSYGKQLRKGVLRGLVHKEFPGLKTDIPKKGFSVPLTRWLREELKEPFAQVLLDKSMAERFGFSANGIEAVFNEHVNGKADNKWTLFTLYALYLWQKGLNDF